MQCAEENDINGYWGLDGPETVSLYDEWGTDTFRNSDFSPFLENEGVGQVPPVCSFPNGEGNAVTVLSSRERQKRYRERQKLKRTTIQNQMNEVSAEYAAVMTENVELKQRNSALQALEAYASTMLNTITSSALHSQLSLSAASLEYLKGLHGRIVDKMLQSLISYEDLISFWDSLKITWHRKYILSLWLRRIANLLKEVRNFVCKLLCFVTCFQIQVYNAFCTNTAVEGPSRSQK